MTADPPTSFQISFDGDPHEVRQALIDLRGRMAALGAQDADLGMAELVVAEVLNNVVEHALADRSDGKVQLTCERQSQGFAFDIMDNGAPMPNGEIPAGIPPEVDTELDDLPEGGWGWSLVRGMADQLMYRHENHQNHLSFVLPLS